MWKIMRTSALVLGVCLVLTLAWNVTAAEGTSPDTGDGVSLEVESRHMEAEPAGLFSGLLPVSTSSCEPVSICYWDCTVLCQTDEDCGFLGPCVEGGGPACSGPACDPEG